MLKQNTLAVLHRFAVLSLLSALAWPLAASAGAQNSAMPKADGSIRMPSFVLPPSDYVSSEFKRAYAEQIASASGSTASPQIPGPSATKAEWDKFDAEFDHAYVAPRLAWNLEHYPVTVVDTKLAGVRVGIITPKEGEAPENQHRVLISLHGGGFYLGRGLGSGQLESIPVASIGRIKVVTVDYRQYPAEQFPAASEDVEAVYRELLKSYKPESIGIYGCSAGGVLAEQAVVRLQLKKLPRPGAVGIFCAGLPAPGKHGDSDMWGLGGVSPQAPATVLGMESVAYMRGADPHDPSAYPGSSDDVLAKFPPTLFLSGTRSQDMSPSIVGHARLLKLGVDSSLYIMEGGWHGANVGALGTPEWVDANTYVARWFARHLAE